MRQTVARLAPLVVILLALGGCQLVGEIIGAGAGGAAAGATANPAVGIAVGVGVNAGIDAAVAYVGRKWQQSEQDAIAAEVGEMQAGEQRPWEIRHVVPIGNEHGEVRVVRAISSALTLCKELVFSVDTGKSTAGTREWYVTDACRDGARWNWALAEPATARWGALQ